MKQNFIAITIYFTIGLMACNQNKIFVKQIKKIPLSGYKECYIFFPLFHLHFYNII
jgi:hypothetical protein